MRKDVSYLLFSLILLFSCKEDEDRVISTDLPTEAAQLFVVSQAWSEALFFSQISYDQYSNSDSLQLPGCPEILIEEITKLITLTFDSTVVCPQNGTFKRSGKLLLDLSQSDSPNPNWFLKYQNYKFEDASINGIRTFNKSSSGLIDETFETLTHKTTNGLTHQFEGEFSHTLNVENEIPIKLNSSGMMSGKNPAGRDFTIVFNETHESLLSCFLDNQILPISGSETWQVSRSETTQVEYNLTYEGLDGCKVEAYVVLPDNRRLLLNP